MTWQHEPVLRTRARTGPTIVLVMCVAATLLAAPTPAAADELRFPDARGDTRSPADIVAVTLVHGDRVVVRVHHRNLSFAAGEAPATVRVIYAVPGCTGERVRVSSELDVTRVSVPRACFGDPERVRVNVRVTPHPEGVGRADDAPGAEQLGPWVGYSPT